MLVVYAVLALAAAWIVFEFWLMFSAAPYIPSSPEQVQAMLELARPQAGELWVDVGSGDGRILLAAARAGARVLGCELSPWRVLQSRARLAAEGFGGRSSVRLGSLWSADLREADVISVYLMPYRMERFKAMLEKQAKPGARVVVNSFPVPGWPIVASVSEMGIYLYVTPPRWTPGRG